MDLKWDYKNRTVTVGIKEYNQKVLKEGRHTKPNKPVDGPTQYTRANMVRKYNMLKMIPHPFFLKKILKEYKS